MLDTFRDHLDVLWGFLTALGIVLILTPAVGRVARVLGVVDQPGERRRMHLRAVPRLGGLGIFLGIFVPALAFLDLEGPYRGILLGAAVAMTVGMVDDFRGLPWWGKLGGQAAAGLTFAVLALSLTEPGAAILSAIVAGACLGFLRHNFYPARIFMGDSGSLLLGFTLAAVAVEGALKTAATVALFFPLLVLAIPILDTSFVVAKRLKYGRPLHEPTPWHLYHRFRDIGFSQSRAALYFYAWGAVLAGAALATRFVPFREGAEWHLWPTVLASVIAFVAVATSVYMVIVLEILKLRRLRAWVEQRRTVDEERELKSA